MNDYEIRCYKDNWSSDALIHVDQMPGHDEQDALNNFKNYMKESRLFNLEDVYYYTVTRLFWA